jgi:signal transduction histidine kinase
MTASTHTMSPVQPAPSPGLARPTWQRWAVLAAVWTLPGLVTSLQVYFLHQRYEPISLVDALLWQLPGWYFWVPATPLVLLLLRTFPLSRGSWQRSLPAHLSATIVLSAAHLAVSVAAGRYAIRYAYYQEEAFGELVLKLLLRNMHLGVITYWGVIAAGYAFTYYRKYRERELVAAQLEARLARAELQALKGQLQPHFVFNTLNAIAVLVRKQDTERAVRTLSRLGELLRRTLDTAGRHVVPLSSEIDFLRRYLEIQQIRFQERLAIEFDVDDDCLDAEVPNLLLQPLVENSVRHGICKRAEGGRIEIRAHRVGDRVRIEILDDGVGLPPQWSLERGGGLGIGLGIGLGNVHARLEQMYPGTHVLEVGNRPTGGVAIIIELPFETTTDSGNHAQATEPS